MARPITIADDDLIEAARRVFSEQGMGATTAEIARRAGVSEGILFKRFRSKGELFHAVMRSIDATGRRWTEGLGARVGRRTLRAELEDAAGEGVAFFRRLVPFHMMAGTNPELLENAKKRWGNTHPALESRRLFETYFESERKLGRLAGVDTEVLARTFIGSLHSFVAMEILTGPFDDAPISEARFVRGLIDMLLGGIAAARATGGEPTTRKPRSGAKARTSAARARRASPKK